MSSRRRMGVSFSLVARKRADMDISWVYQWVSYSGGVANQD